MSMKNFLKKIHIGSNQSDDSEGSTSSPKGNSKLSDVSSPERVSQSSSHHSSEVNPFSAIQGWLNSVTNRNIPSPPSSLSLGREEMLEPSDSVSSSALEAALEAVRRDSESSNAKDPDIEEEYQIQLALELSAREDPEAVQIEAVKQISLGSSDPDNTPAEVLAYRYWNYNALSYDDKILDGFYDLYGILLEPASSTMPSLVDLQRMPVSDNISWEAILVNRAGDSRLLNIEQKALEVALASRTEFMNYPLDCLVKYIASLVSDHMGGPVKDPDSMLLAWRSLCFNLKASLGSMVLPLGSLKIGLARHRALLFKVLADSVGIPCRLVKGQQYTGSDDVAINFVKINDGREYIVDLMADPGTLIPSDAAAGHVDCDEPLFSVSPLSGDADSSQVAYSSSEVASSFEDHSDFGGDRHSGSRGSDVGRNESSSNSDYMPDGSTSQIIQAEEDSRRSSHNFKKPHHLRKDSSKGIRHRTSHPYSHVRSPSWTEGVSSPAARRMKVKDVSQYMLDAAKENPQLAQKLHDVLLESGVVAPPNLFTEVYQEELNTLALETIPPRDHMESQRRDDSKRNESRDDHDQICFLPPLPHHNVRSKANYFHGGNQNLREATEEPAHLESESSLTKYSKNVPVAAAAAAAAAVVASSMVVAAAKTSTDSNIEIPVSAAATATAAAVMATTAAVSKQYDNLEISPHSPDSIAALLRPLKNTKIDGENEISVYDQKGSGERDHENSGTVSDGERISDRSTGSTKSDRTFDDVADCEIPYEDIILGERIGLGSYGEVYRGDWHGTAVAVKRFLDQNITGDSLEEFKSEVGIMKRVRHPNVVLFMGAVTRPPNLSIITEFLPRGSLYRLLHRPNNQLDERRRLRMAFDTARGMNYLHNCSPVIVHRDLKTPNLLVDKNWVVKVCDFGLSRMKHNTYLSSRSTAGTAEWMAPEVLRNEPSDEKCDVYSFGVILWELCTLQQPWGGMNPMQVVGAVGFQHRRLDIPDDMDPIIADLIQRCWQTDPKLRPSFAEIMGILKPLQKPITAPQVLRPNVPASQRQSSRFFEESGFQR